MIRSDPWFLGYMLSDETCQYYLGVCSIALLTFMGLWSVMMSILDHYNGLEWDVCQLMKPVQVFHYSPVGELQAWDGYVRFVRSGACVGKVWNGVVAANWAGDKSDRILEIAYSDSSIDRFSCGPVGWRECLRIREIVMRFAGRHAYG